MTNDIAIERRDDVTVVTLNRPGALNAWTMSMEAELADTLSFENERSATAGIVITGAGERAFCAGQDLHETAQFSPDQVDGWLATFQGLYEGLLSVDKPVVAALNGVAAGSGYQVALLCDVRVAHPGVRMGQPEVSSGIPSITGMYLTERALGSSRMMELMLSGRLMEIDELTTIGLVHHVVEPRETLAKSVEAAQQIAAQPSAAVALTKQRRRDVILPELREAFAAAAETDRKAWESGQPQEVMRNFFAARRQRDVRNDRGAETGQE